jgi:glycosyltransferase involved in cell wall biosynthesis
MKKICYLCDENFDFFDAKITHISHVINNLSKQGLEVTLIAPKPRSKLIEGIAAKSVLIPVLKKSIIKNLVYQFLLSFYLIVFILKERPEAFYVRQNATLIVHVLLSRMFSIPIITEINGVLCEELKSEGIPKFVISLVEIIEHLSYLNSKFIIANSLGLKKYIEKKYNIESTKIKVIGIGVNPKLFRPLDKKYCRKKLRIPINGRYVLYAGGLTHWQGVDYLIESVSLLNKNFNNLSLLIVGTGPERENLKKICNKLGISKKVVFLNSVPNNQIPEYLGASDICVCYLTRFKEGKYGPPTKVYEYMASQRPVIFSKLIGMENFLEKNKVLLSKPENSIDLARKIEYLLRNKKISDRLAKIGRKYVVKNFSWEKIAKQIISLLNEAQRRD